MSPSDPIDQDPHLSMVATAVTGGGTVQLIRVPGRTGWSA